MTATANGAPTNLGTVLPLGDSITSGNTVAGSTPGAWRDPFYQDATAQGVSMQFVGTLTTVSTPLLNSSNQEYHSGYSGDEIVPDPANGRGGIDEIWNDVIEGEAGIQANWILLQIGANDLLVGVSPATVGARYATLLHDIHQDDPTAKVICGSLAPSLAIPVAQLDATDVYIQQDVAADAALGWNVAYADVGHSYTTADMTDLYHPTQEGDNLLGAAWLAAVQDYPNETVPEPGLIGVAAVGGLLTLQRRNSNGRN